MAGAKFRGEPRCLVALFVLSSSAPSVEGRVNSQRCVEARSSTERSLHSACALPLCHHGRVVTTSVRGHRVRSVDVCLRRRDYMLVNLISK